MKSELSCTLYKFTRTRVAKAIGREQPLAPLQNDSEAFPAITGLGNVAGAAVDTAVWMIVQNCILIVQDLWRNPVLSWGLNMQSMLQES